MDKEREILRKERQKICEKCMLGDTIENCRICLINLFKENFSE